MPTEHEPHPYVVEQNRKHAERRANDPEGWLRDQERMLEEERRLWARRFWWLTKQRHRMQELAEVVKECAFEMTQRVPADEALRASAEKLMEACQAVYSEGYRRQHRETDEVK